MKKYEVRALVTVEYEFVFNVEAEDEKKAREVISNNALCEFGGNLIEVDSRHIPECYSNHELGVEFAEADVYGSSLDIQSVEEIEEEEEANA